LSTTSKIFKEVILKVVQRHIEERGLLNASQFGFHAHHSTTLQCIRLIEHVILNFNNNIYMAAVFLNIEKALDTTWHLGLLYKLSELKFLISLIKLISSFLYQRKLRVFVEGEMSEPRDIEAGVLQVSILSPTLYSIYENDMLQTPTVYLYLSADDTFIMRQTAKRVVFSESCSKVLVLL
jgi:hypothetical protein